MSSFSEANFQKKLADLNASQQSIQTFSLWLIHHRKHSKTIVQLWLKELKKVKPSKKLTFLYLANDVIQNSKKKGPEFNRDFRLVLPHAYSHTAREADDKIQGSMDRMLNIWKERGVFEEALVETIRTAMAKSKSRGKARASSKASAAEKKERREKRAEKKEPAKKKKKVELTLREEIEQELSKEPPGDPPDADDLVTSLEGLENAASTDAAVREKIAALPPEVSDASLLTKVNDQESAAGLTSTVDEACNLLEDYNSRLSEELQDRRKVAKMLREYLQHQKDVQQEADTKLQEYKTKLENVSTVRNELKTHIQSLPDLTLLPDVTGLAPLPSAGDLFSAQLQ